MQWLSRRVFTPVSKVPGSILECGNFVISTGFFNRTEQNKLLLEVPQWFLETGVSVKRFGDCCQAAALYQNSSILLVPVSLLSHMSDLYWWHVQIAKLDNDLKRITAEMLKLMSLLEYGTYNSLIWMSSMLLWIRK